MDAFHILSRGGEFNKNKYKKDVARFSVSLYVKCVHSCKEFGSQKKYLLQLLL